MGGRLDVRPPLERAEGMLAAPLCRTAVPHRSAAPQCRTASGF